MKVCIVGPSRSSRGGIASVLQILIRFLEDQGINVVPVATSSEVGRFQQILAFLDAWRIVFSLCLLRKVDIVHLHMASRGSCLRKSILALTCFCLKMPYIIHLHGAEFQTFFTNELGYSGKAFVRLIFSKAFRVIGLSSAWGIWIAETFKSAHVSVIFNGVPSSKPKKKGGGVEKLTILFLGRLSERKGTNDLIEAMQEVVKVFPEALLELGGDGDINAYRSKTANFDYVQVLGWMNDEQRLAALGRATIYCLPSWNEGLPMSILEAMSAELPIISTPVGGIPEAVVHGVTGLLVPPGDVKAIADSICMLLSEPSLCKEMGIAGRSHHLALFSDIAMGSQILDVYKSCLQH